MPDPKPELTARVAQCLVGNAVWLSDGQNRCKGIVRGIDVEQNDAVTSACFLCVVHNHRGASSRSQTLLRTIASGFGKTLICLLVSCRQKSLECW
jgi:hypothetical protein